LKTFNKNDFNLNKVQEAHLNLERKTRPDENIQKKKKQKKHTKMVPAPLKVIQ